YYVQEGHPLLLLGRGGAQAESADVRPAPLSDRELADFARLAAPDDAALVESLLAALQAWALERPWVRAVDLNPVVRHGASLVALDAKVHRVSGGESEQGEAVAVAVGERAG